MYKAHDKFAPSSYQKWPTIPYNEWPKAHDNLQTHTKTPSKLKFALTCTYFQLKLCNIQVCWLFRCLFSNPHSVLIKSPTVEVKIEKLSFQFMIFEWEKGSFVDGGFKNTCHGASHIKLCKHLKLVLGFLNRLQNS